MIIQGHVETNYDHDLVSTPNLLSKKLEYFNTEDMASFKYHVV